MLVQLEVWRYKLDLVWPVTNKHNPSSAILNWISVDHDHWLNQEFYINVELFEKFVFQNSYRGPQLMINNWKKNVWINKHSDSNKINDSWIIHMNYETYSLMIIKLILTKVFI